MYPWKPHSTNISSLKPHQIVTLQAHLSRIRKSAFTAFQLQCLRGRPGAFRMWNFPGSCWVCFFSWWFNSLLMVIQWDLMGFNGIQWRFNGSYPLVNVYITNWKDPPFYSWENSLFQWAIFHSYVTNYQRVWYGDAAVSFQKCCAGMVAAGFGWGSIAELSICLGGTAFSLSLFWMNNIICQYTLW